VQLVSKISYLCGADDPPTLQTDGRHAMQGSALCGKPLLKRFKKHTLKTFLNPFPALDFFGRGSRSSKCKNAKNACSQCCVGKI